MEIVRVLMVVAAGMGLTWLAQQIVDGPQLHAQTPAIETSEAPGGGSAVDSVLEEAEAADADELEEFAPTKPLPADEAVSMPADI